MPTNRTDSTGSAGSPASSRFTRPAQRNPFRSFVSTALPGEELANARRLPLDLIDVNPHQARQQFDEVALEELASSIKEHGVLQPIGVVRNDKRYRIVFGERRYRASVLAEKTDIPAVIYDDMSDEDAAILTALENLQREDLDLEDEARQFAFLLEMTGMSQRKLADALGINHVYLSRRVRLLKRPDLLNAYNAGKMNLHEVVARVDKPADDVESVSQGNSGETKEPELVLVEREDMSGFVVSRGNSDSGVSMPIVRATRFRWRPAMHFRNWLTRTRPEEIPADERASFAAQIVAIRAALDDWERSLAQWQPPEQQAGVIGDADQVADVLDDGGAEQQEADEKQVTAES